MRRRKGRDAQYEEEQQARSVSPAGTLGLLLETQPTLAHWIQPLQAARAPVRCRPPPAPLSPARCRLFQLCKQPVRCRLQYREAQDGIKLCQVCRRLWTPDVTEVPQELLLGKHTHQQTLMCCLKEKPSIMILISTRESHILGTGWWVAQTCTQQESSISSAEGSWPGRSVG